MSCVTLEFDRGPWKKNRVPPLCYVKLCTSFRSHRGIQTGVAVRKRPIWVQIDDFFVLCDLKNRWMALINKGTSPIPHQALCIISSPCVNSNWSLGPDTSMTLTFHLWLWPFAWTSLISMITTPENFIMIRWWEHNEKSVTGARTDRRTEPFIELLGCSLKGILGVAGVYNAHPIHTNRVKLDQMLGSYKTPDMQSAGTPVLQNIYHKIFSAYLIKPPWYIWKNKPVPTRH